jgi:hypothetical protein
VADYHGQDCATICFDGYAVEFFTKVGFTLLKTIVEPFKKSNIKLDKPVPPAQILVRRPRVDIDHSLSSLSLSHSSLESSGNNTNKDRKRSSKHVL